MFIRFLISILLMLFSSQLFADSPAIGSGIPASDAGGGLPNTLAPPAGDLSISLLASIFGVVDGVLHGTGSQILGSMFGIYNAAILTMGMIILVYIFIVGTLNTAHEGEVMGKKWSSIWLPLRTVTGVALLLPKATGYSFIQIMVMWVVVQGVGAADLVWNKSIDYLLRGGVVVAPSSIYGTTPGGSNTGYVAGSAPTNVNAFLIPIAGTIFKSEICMYALQNILINKYPKKQIPFLVNTLKVEQGTGTRQFVIKFPGAVDIGDGHSKDYPGMCGSVSWTASNDAIVAQPPKVPGQPSLPVVATDSRSVAVQQVVLDLQPAAQRIANSLVPSKSGATVANVLPLSALLVKNDLFYATADYVGIMTPFITRQERGTTGYENALRESQRVGRIMAGAYYFEMVQLKAAQSIKEDQVVQASFPDLGCTDASKCKSFFLTDLFQPVAKQLMASEQSAGCAGNYAGNTVEEYICNTEFKSNQYKQDNNQLNPNIPGSGGLAPPSPIFAKSERGSDADLSNIFINIVSLGISGAQASVQNVFASMGSIYNAQTIGGNPIIMVGQLGIDIVSAVERIFISGIAIILAAVTLGSVIAFGFGPGVGMGLLAVLAWLLPLIAAILMPLLTAGAIMAWYIPLIPFILFVFGAFTWFAAVIEAMIAAPLVALGLVHPDGHEHLGRAEQAVMLLAGVFLRPLLMIFGFVAATILSSIMLWLVNYGFAKVWINVQADWLQILYFVATVIVYMFIVLEVINKSFSLIYEVPNRVLRWIGGQPETTGEAASLAEIKGGVTSGLGTTTQVAGQFAGKAADLAMEGGKKAISGAGGEVETKITPK